MDSLYLVNKIMYLDKMNSPLIFPQNYVYLYMILHDLVRKKNVSIFFFYIYELYGFFQWTRIYFSHNLNNLENYSTIHSGFYEFQLLVSENKGLNNTEHSDS